MKTSAREHFGDLLEVAVKDDDKKEISPRSKTRPVAQIGMPLTEEDIKVMLMNEKRIGTASVAEIPILPKSTHRRARSMTTPVNAVAPELGDENKYDDMSDTGLNSSQLKGAQFPVSVYGVPLFAIYRDHKVYYVADGICKKLKSPLPTPETFSENMAHRVNDVERASWLVNSAGLLKIIANGTTEHAEQILFGITSGIPAMMECDRLVRKAESARRKKIRREKEAFLKLEQEELEKLEQEMQRKKEERRRRREEKTNELLKEVADSPATQPPFLASLRRKSVIGSFKEIQVLEEKRKRRQTLELVQRREMRRIHSGANLLGTKSKEQPDTEEEKPKEEEDARSTESQNYAGIQERTMSDVPFPEMHELTIKEVYCDQGLPSLSVLMKHFSKEGKVTRECAEKILEDAEKILLREDNLFEITAPCVLFGDIHGQLFDLVDMLKKVESPESTTWLFLGDYVDRGAFGCEVSLLLLAAKARYPKKVFLLRGNHVRSSKRKRRKRREKMVCF